MASVSDPRLDYEARLTIEGEGDPLVYVPGMDGTGDLFYRQIPRLMGRYRVATYSLRDEAETMETLVRDLAVVVEKIAPDAGPATIVGESFGGALSLSFALARPDLVDRLLVINSFPRLRSRLRLRLAIAAVWAFPWMIMPIVRRVTASRLHSDHTSRETIREFLTHTRKTTRLGYWNRLRILLRYDVRDRLGEIRRPTLFLAADEDRLIASVEQARVMASRVPDAVVRVLEGHGHACLLAPDLDLAEILEEWRPAPGH